MGEVVPFTVDSVSQLIECDGDELRMSSRELARLFGREHFNVLNAVRDEMAALARKGQKGFADLNFQVSSYVDVSGRSLPHFWLTEDGVYQVGMGFTGDDAALLRCLIIQAFRSLRQSAQAALEAPSQLLLDLSASSKRVETKLDDTHRTVVTFHNDYLMTQRYVRKPVSAKTRAFHVRVVHARFGGICPCCGRIRIIDVNGCEIGGAAECDHNYTNSDPRREATWLICKACHDQITPSRPGETQPRDEVQQFFVTYQLRAKQFLSERPPKGQGALDLPGGYMNEART